MDSMEDSSEDFDTIVIRSKSRHYGHGEFHGDNSAQYNEDGSCTFGNKYNSDELRAELTRQRKSGQFVDVVVEVEGREFPCHRAVLAITPYFKTMFSSNLVESKAKVITLHDIDSGSFSKILDFVYMGEILICKDDVQDILQAAHMLQVEEVLRYCKKFIQKNLCPSNCVGVMCLADMYGLCDLKTTARRKALSQFSEFGRNCNQCYHVTDLPTPIVGCISVASAGRYLYVTGGRAVSLLHLPSKQAFRYDFATDTWTRLPDMPRGRAGHQSAIVDGKLYLVGGDTAETLFNVFSMECYNIEAEAWIKPPEMPAIIPSPNLKVIACGGKLLLIQGLRKKRRLCVHAFDVETQGWTYSSTPNPAIDFNVAIRATAVNNKVHLYVDRCFSCYVAAYTYDVDKETPTIEEEKPKTQEDVYIVHGVCRNRKYYVNAQNGIINTIPRINYGKVRSPDQIKEYTRRPNLPFALFGHGFLATKKSRVGWFCRDQLAEVEKELQDADEDYETTSDESESDDDFY
uniref:BTB domain-containing protein n=1 Tax=Branchiostoma floridae TaxID=7739 RepID=C3ZTA5_BRAFL|eukprot:XP_002588141.1 hypothetical protein BRAFLDRAFT_68779 [Branchiostoma floridae]